MRDIAEMVRNPIPANHTHKFLHACANMWCWQCGTELSYSEFAEIERKRLGLEDK